MKIEITKDFRLDLDSQIRYISKDKPIAARKFKADLIKNIKKDLKNPFILRNPDIIMMKTLEIMFLKDILLSIMLI